MLEAVSGLSARLQELNSLSLEGQSFVVTAPSGSLPDARLHWEFDGSEGPLGDRLRVKEFKAVSFKTDIEEAGFNLLFDDDSRPSPANEEGKTPLNYFWRMAVSSEAILNKELRVDVIDHAGETILWLGANATKAAA